MVTIAHGTIATLRDWTQVIDTLQCSDTYPSVGYHTASAHLETPETRPILLHVTGDNWQIALPLLLRPLPTGDGYDATSAYGYGGPVATGNVDLEGFTRALAAWAKEHAIVATFLRFHPLLRNERWAPRNATVTKLGETVSWRIAASRGELLPTMHQHHRRAVRKAGRAGVTSRVSVRPTSLDAFREMYDETMHRLDAGSYYFFEDAYWQALVDHLGDDLVLVDGLLDGRPVASLLCFARGSTLHYHLGASTDEARAVGASNLSFLAAAEWGQARGMDQFHLGGGLGGDSASSLFTFKHRYDPENAPLPFYIAKLVHDPARYLELAGTTSSSGFFPPWRHPDWVPPTPVKHLA